MLLDAVATHSRSLRPLLPVLLPLLLDAAVPCGVFPFGLYLLPNDVTIHPTSVLILHLKEIERVGGDWLTQRNQTNFNVIWVSTRYLVRGSISRCPPRAC